MLTVCEHLINVTGTVICQIYPQISPTTRLKFLQWQLAKGTKAVLLFIYSSFSGKDNIFFLLPYFKVI